MFAKSLLAVVAVLILMPVGCGTSGHWRGDRGAFYAVAPEEEPQAESNPSTSQRLAQKDCAPDGNVDESGRPRAEVAERAAGLR